MKKLFVVIICLLVGYLIISDINIGDKIIQRKVNKLLESMSLDEKIGQMLMIYYDTTTYDDTLSSYIKSTEPGGFIIFKDNVESYNQLSTLIDDMQNNSNIPMFISIDQEGGRVQRIKNINNISTIPSMESVGDKDNEDLTYQVGTVIGEELSVFGINMDNAPVLDVRSNPNNTVIGDRSFSSNASIASKLGLSLAKGLNDSNIIPVYKHFPGHGDTDVDSHYGLPVLNKTKKELYNLELIPFIDAINNGAEVIMVAHIALPEITGDNTPSSLSPIIINNLLRKELGFNGVVISDGLNMKALTDNYTTDEILVKAINAGVDILLMPPFSDTTVRVIKDAVNNNQITIKQIDDAVKRILTLKYKHNLFKQQIKVDKDVLGNTKHQGIINRIIK